MVWFSSALVRTGDTADLPAVRELRQQADIVICPEGQILEGIPGGHGKGRLHHPTRIDFRDPIASLNQLFDGGTRTALLVGDTAFARELVARDAIDQALLEVPRANSDIVAADQIQERPISGFRIETVTTTSDAIRIIARPDAPPDLSDSRDGVGGE